LADKEEQDITVQEGDKPALGAAKITIARRHNTVRDWMRIVGIGSGVIGCLFAMALGTFFGRYFWDGGSLGKMTRRMVSNFVTFHSPDATWQPEIQFPQKTAMNILILGVDHDYDNRDQIIRTTNGRSDSIMLARVDFVNNTIKALTIPRDTAVHIPDHRGIHKINAAHNFGGPPLTIETIRSVFGVDTDAYVVLNFEGFQQVVDAIGGIDVNVTKKLDYDDNWGNLHIHLLPGYQHMNGYKAMGFVRMRHSDSDEMRSKRQHEFLEAMRAKVKQPQTLYNLPNVVNKVHENLKRGNLTEDQLYALINFARKLPKENIEIQTLPSYEGPSYVTVDAEKSATLIQRLFFPNQVYAFNIDAPDPTAVRSMNSRYDRSGHKKNAKKDGAAAALPPSADSDLIQPDPGQLTVEDRAARPKETDLNAAPPGDAKPDTKPETKPDAKPADPAPTTGKDSKDQGTKKSDTTG
jgi:LCP family protein required for cell wall assembly